MGVEAGTKARTRPGPGIGLQNRAKEVLPEWEPFVGPWSLANSSFTWSIGGRFR